MPNNNKIIHTDDELKMGSQYLRYHLKMYEETLLWIQDHQSSNSWNTVRNAVLEDHLVHARVLINFLSKDDTSKRRKDDVLAMDYFINSKDVFEPLQDIFLNNQAKDIGGQAVHIIKKPMPKLKSQQDWPIGEIASRLIPGVESFLNAVPETSLADGVKNDCLDYLEKLKAQQILVSIYPST